MSTVLRYLDFWPGLGLDLRDIAAHYFWSAVGRGQVSRCVLRFVGWGPGFRAEIEDIAAQCSPIHAVNPV